MPAERRVGFLATVGGAVADWPKVRFAAVVSGRVNLVLSVLCPTTDDLYTSVAGDRIGALPGVGALETTVTLRRLKTVTRHGA